MIGETHNMSVLHVYDNKGLFENHPIGHCKKFYHTVYNEKEDQDEVVFLPTISGVDMFGIYCLYNRQGGSGSTWFEPG